MVQSRRNFFYKRITVTDTAFPAKAQIDFGFQATRVLIVNDGEDTALTFSFLKPHVDGELFCSDGPLAFDGLAEGKLWFMVDQPAEVRVWAWRR